MNARLQLSEMYYNLTLEMYNTRLQLTMVQKKNILKYSNPQILDMFGVLL